LAALQKKLDFVTVEKEKIQRNRDEIECELRAILSTDRRDTDINSLRL
jgi:hypothetical protein